MPIPGQRLPTLLLTPICLRCGQDIKLIRIAPAAPGHDLRTFECGDCGYSTNVDFEIRRNPAQG